MKKKEEGSTVHVINGIFSIDEEEYTVKGFILVKESSIIKCNIVTDFSDSPFGSSLFPTFILTKGGHIEKKENKMEFSIALAEQTDEDRVYFAWSLEGDGTYFEGKVMIDSKERGNVKISLGPKIK